MRYAVLAVAALVLLSASPAAASSPRARLAERLSLGGEHACYVHANGDVYCWGHNDMGQLGEDPSVLGFTNVPHLVPLSTKATQVVTGLDFTCVLDENGDIWCFGNRAFGRLGDGMPWRSGPEPGPVPRLVANSGDFVQLAAGSAHACAIKSTGVLYCWGWNAKGQVGPGGNPNQLSPVAVKLGAGAIDVTAGAEFTCALRSDRRVQCWGANFAGQLGDGTLTSRSYALFVQESVPGIGFLPLENVADLESGFSHTCAIKADGHVVCWGSGSKGQLGDGSIRPFSMYALENGLTNAVALSSGTRADHTCVVRGDGNTFCWGRNDHGQIGNATISPSVPTPIGPLLPNGAVQLSAGENDTCAALATGAVRCWGWNQFGEVGAGTSKADISVPVTVTGLPSALAGLRIAPGASQTCATKSDGNSFCWGSTAHGDGTTGARWAPATPVNYTGFGQGWQAKELASGRNFSCAVMSYGSVNCWGANADGQIGNGTTTYAPVGVPVLNTAIDVAAGEYHTCAVLADGSVRCWGRNGDGQLGDFTTFDKWTPTVAWADRVYRIGAGQAFTCALDWGGNVECWGRNWEGQLGDGTTTSSSGPVRVIDMNGSLLTRVVDIAVSRASACALRDDGSVWCWGSNLSGELGDGTFTSSSRAVPIDVNTYGRFVEIGGGGDHFCALGSVNLAYCWGDNSYGQLGDGTTVNRSVPTAVATGTMTPRIRSLGVGIRDTCNAAVDGTAYCWGFNLYGQLGAGFWTGYETLPVQVVGYP
jgi:alpha-tubulin suppressor-like RCC1 family protein